ncbi:M3 family metallopeptidase [Piscinibacter sp.]|jgi:peptidyl-dipeptidase Dcp|uniref:M3 family metallopeptidase n=1 Tax=Piscinibacter sp. TaxID=1903157 RepID=UPI002F411F21
MTLATSNPLLQPWNAPYGLPPFARIDPAHFKPAFEQALREQLAEVETIANASQAPSFDNTLAAFDRSGRLLARLDGLFYNLTSSETSPALQAVEMEMAPLMAAHASAIYMHAGLFKRIDALHAQRDTLDLGPEQRRLLERVHLDFVRAGAQLAPAAQARYAQVMERLAELTTRFAQNVLADESFYQLVLRGDAELAGLPDFVCAAARQAAVERGVHDACVITLSRSHIVPFLTFSERRDLREQAYRAWTTRGEHEGAHDNRPIAREILTLRREQARLHGHASYADYALADTMAGTPAAVTALLQQVWGPAKARVAQEREALRALLASRGEALQIEGWDWRYLAEKLRQQRYDLDEAALKPYFPLERMVEAAFDCANRLFGLRFVEQPAIQVYHPDVKVYEVRAADDALAGVFLHDNFARPSKRSGAWMSSYRQQSRNGDEVLPIVVNNNNFAKGAPGEPTLLSFDDASTLFHEFGHGLHGLLSNVTYERLSGTNVLRDFVELPSQLFEHWLEEPEVLKRHARHHRTGEPIPDELVQRLKAARRFNQGYETVRYAASALVDMAVHSLGAAEAPDISAFEAAELERIGMPPGIGINHRLAHFQHLFSGSSYAAGYYVYLWAEVLDADGYEAFVEAGDPFDPAVAQRLRRFVYASGNSLEPSQAYRAFRGRAPTVEPMLRQRGLLRPKDGML